MKKSFGQNLLVDTKYLNLSKEIIEAYPKSDVIEIGSGSGNLTKILSKKFKRVYACELEKDILKSLKAIIKNDNLKNVEIIEGNFLDLDLTKFNDFHIAGNIPYHITSQIIIKLLGEIGSPSASLKETKNIYLMVQKEVAERLCATPHTKDYSPLTLLAQFYTIPKLLFIVPKKSFHPIPKVDSAFIELKPKDKFPEVKDLKLLKKLIRTSFQQRRKKILNSMEEIIPKEELNIILQKLNISPNLRPENLSLEDFINISDSWEGTHLDRM